MLKPMRVLRAIFGPILHQAWLYPGLPTLFLLGAVSASPDMPIVEYLRRWGVAFAYITCIGLPMHLTYAHFGDRFLGDRFAWRELPYHVVVIGGSVLLGTEILIGILRLAAGEQIGPSAEVMRLRRIFWATGSMGGALVTAILLSLDRYRDRLAEVERRESEAQKASLTAQVQALQARIQPHFLFNCLNTVAGLIEEDPARAERAVEKLSDLFRYTLDASSESAVPLEAEIAVVRDFLELETLRYGGRLKAAVHADPDTLALPVPPLVLQPLVENAVLHGIARRREGGRLEVETRREGDRLVLRVEDDGPGPGASEHRGSGTALADLRRRLELIYAGRATLVEDRGALGGYRLCIELPIAGGEHR